MKISSTAFLRLCEKAKNRNVSDNMMNLLVDLAYRHVLREKWTHGNPCEVFMRDGVPLHSGMTTAFGFTMMLSKVSGFDERK